MIDDLADASPEERASVWLRLVLHLEANGPLLVPRVADVVPSLRRSTVLDTLVVLADAGLIQLRTARGVALRSDWRERLAGQDRPPDDDAETWAAFARLAATQR